MNEKVLEFEPKVINSIQTWTVSDIDPYQTDTLKLAEQIAREAHDGQFRNDGKTPYINHVEAVVNGVDFWYNRFFLSDLYLSVVKKVAWLHDVVEDTDITLEDLSKEGFSDNVVSAVKALTKIKCDGWSYRNYIIGIANNDRARVVKLADLTHNMSDLKPGNLYDKYDLTKCYLENRHT